MAKTDIISKDIIKRLIKDISHYIFGLDLAQVEVLETQFQRVEERRADIVVKVAEASGRVYLLHIEIQSYNASDISWRMLRYLSDVALQWPDYEIEQYLIYVGKRSFSMAEGIVNKHLDYRYHVVDMHQIDCQYFLSQDNPDALVLAILCDFKGRNKHEVVRHIIGELKRYYADNEKGFRDSISMLEVLSANRDLKDVIRKEEKNMLSMRLDELPSYDIGFEKGVEKGIEKGIEKERTIVVNLYKAGADMALISQGTGLSAKEIKDILSKQAD